MPTIITEQEVVRVREMYAHSDLTQLDLALKFRVSPQAIHAIVTGKSHKNAKGRLTISRPKQDVIE